MDARDVGNRIAELRKSLHLTQQQLAEMLSVTNKAVSKWETGNGLPDIAILPSLTAALGVNVNEIISADTENHQNQGNRRYDKKPAFWMVVTVIVIIAAVPIGVLIAGQRSSAAGITPAPLSPLQEATGASGGQLASIEEALSRHSIHCKTVSMSNNPVVAGMDEHFAAYDLVDENDVSFVLILRKSDFDFISVLESNGRQIEGIIDRSITPALFIEGDYLFDKDRGSIPKSAKVPAGSTRIDFPVSEKGKTEYNAFIYDAAPFWMSVTFPDHWSCRERDPKVIYVSHLVLDTVFSVLDIMNENGELVGAVGYNRYEIVEGAEDDPRAIYHQIALGNHYHFDVRDSYTVIKETDSGTTATADVYYSAVFGGGEEKNNVGIISHNRDLLVYIVMEFDRDLITDEQVNDIAESLLLS